MGQAGTVQVGEFHVKRPAPVFSTGDHREHEMAAAVLSRGFQSDVMGDERYIAEARRVLSVYLAGYYGAELEQYGTAAPVLESAE